MAGRETAAQEPWPLDLTLAPRTRSGGPGSCGVVAPLPAACRPLPPLGPSPHPMDFIRPRKSVLQPRGVVAKHSGLWIPRRQFESARGYEP